jgi:predicted dehydrogenase
MLRYPNGARGLLWASQVAPGNENALRLRVYGENGGLEWSQEAPNALRFARHGRAPVVLTRGGPGIGPAAVRVTRVPSGHPEGYLEGFANLYTDFAEKVTAVLEGRNADPASGLVPTVEDGAQGVKFVCAAIASSHSGGVWVDAGNRHAVLTPLRE